MSQDDWQSIAARLEAACHRRGFDLLTLFGVGHAPEGLEAFGRDNPLGVLIGNTRQLWPVFTRARELDPELAQAEHPLDRYVVRELTRAVSEATSVAAHLIFSHVTTPQPFPMARLAERIGLAAISPSHFAIHPLHGPWFGLRAVVTFDVPGQSSAPPQPARPCRNCSAPCMPALEHAIAVTGSPITAAGIAQHASDWIAVRDACPVGPGSRYGEQQLLHHYGQRQRQGS